MSLFCARVWLTLRDHHGGATGGQCGQASEVYRGGQPPAIQLEVTTGLQGLHYFPFTMSAVWVRCRRFSCVVTADYSTHGPQDGAAVPLTTMQYEILQRLATKPWQTKHDLRVFIDRYGQRDGVACPQ
jgi:hypothetical protein